VCRPREPVRALENGGFVFPRSKASHSIYYHPDTGRRITVPYHGGRIIPAGTLANILREAEIDREKLGELLKK
jgi:predicted RNA binding protein YcfA (HicA-like mRNA interferase family)